MKIPPSIRREHEELHADLARATQAPGRIGAAARTVGRLLHPHFLREDEYATPPLGLLARVAQGQVTLDMAEVLPLTNRLKEELPLMLEEHRAILGALQELLEAAVAERNEEYRRFADALIMHAQMEEEVLYPAAILVGEYVKLKLSEDREGAPR
jgi:hypothetical protein